MRTTLLPQRVRVGKLRDPVCDGEEAVQSGSGALIDTSNPQCSELGSGNGPFVIDCAGCPIGLNMQEQVSWAIKINHPMMDFPKLGQTPIGGKQMPLRLTPKPLRLMIGEKVYWKNTRKWPRNWNLKGKYGSEGSPRT